MTTIPISSGLYYDFSFPLTLINFLVGLLKGQAHNPNTPQVTQATGVRQWFSQPRPGSDATTEVHTTRYKLPLSISEFTFSALRVPCHLEVWYQDRSNNWLPMLDPVRLPIALDLSGADVVSWYTHHSGVYPIVAKAVQIRAKRRPDALLGSQPFVIGLAEILARRNVYDRSSGTQAFEDEQDLVGNIITKYIRDWGAPLAIDDNATTFWKCAAQPDPAAVVNYFQDISDKVTGAPVAVNRLYIDPVYTGQHLNIYYSSDDTVGTRNLSPVTAVPVQDVNTNWTLGIGRRDVSVGIGEGTYQWDMALGPLLRQDAWVGIEWTPDFLADDGPAINPVLFRVWPDVVTTGVYVPTIYYDVGAGEVVCELTDGTDTVEVSASLAQTWALGEPLRIAVGWRYGTDGTDTVYLAVKNHAGDVLAAQISHPTLPDNISFDGKMGFDRFRGLMTAHVVKLESYVARADAFQANPVVYANPDPVIADPNGVVPSTSLDNAVYAADWTAQEHGTGGNHDTAFSDKEWTPIWKNYVTERGSLNLPQTIVAKYLKFELTNLTPEPYPIYDSSIGVTYQVFPISVTQQSAQGLQVYSKPGGFLGLGDVISVNGVRTVNFLNPFSVLDAVQAVFGNTVDPVVINTQPPIISTTIPANTGITSASQTYGIELGNSYIYRRDALNPYILAKDQYYTTIKAEGLQQISAYTDVPWQAIEASNPGAIQHKASPGALPIQGTDWWIFPGQTLKIPASVMTQLTSGDTVTDFHADLTHRTRFVTTSVHRYETRTLIRDKAIAYFAGFREIQPFVTTYVAGQDVDVFEFTSYDSSQWTMTNTVVADTGPVTTSGSPYVVPNAKFLSGLNHWEQRHGSWNQDTVTVDHSGEHFSATVNLSGNSAVDLVSEIIPVAANADTVFSVWVRYNGLVTGTSPTISLRIIPCDGVTEGSVTDLDGDFALWTARAGRTDGFVYEKLVGTYHVPSADVNGVKIVAHAAGYTAGQLWVDDVDMTPADGGEAILSKSFQTTSTFNMVQCDFRDSGLVRSDPMWADIDPQDDTNIPNDLLTWYTTPIPGDIPRGFWADSFATWADPDVAWGEPHAVIAVNIDGTLVYQGKRTLHFTRDAGVGQAGVRVRQWTHFLPDVKARINAIFRKQVGNDNEVTVRLRRVSDGVVIYEETLTDTPIGFWYHYQSPFFEIPDEIDQVYNLEFTLLGDDADDVYLSDIYTEISNIRYLVLLGDSGPTNPYVDVTDLVYSGKETYLSHTVPVSTMSVQIVIKSPEAWAIGASLTPNYLRT